MDLTAIITAILGGVFAQEGIAPAVISGVVTLLGIITAAVIAYLVGRRQQRANVTQTETQTRISESAAEVANAKLAVETRLLDIEAKQAEVGYYQGLVDDMQIRIKEKDAERAMEQAALRAQVTTIEAVQAEAKTLHNQHIDELLASIEGMIASLAAADSKIVVLQGQIDELQLKVEGSNAIIAGMQEEMLKDKAVIAGLRQEIQGMLTQSVDKAEAATQAITKALE